MACWEETHPGQVTQTDKRRIPDHMTQRLAYKHGGKKEEVQGYVWSDGVALPK